jgi:hypothetical protein
MLIKIASWVWQCTSVIPAFKRLRQEIVSSRLAWATYISCLNKKKNKKCIDEEVEVLFSVLLFIFARSFVWCVLVNILRVGKVLSIPL